MKFALGLLCLIPGLALADKLFDLPSASKVRNGEFVIRHRADQSKLGRGTTGIATGLGQSLDIEFSYLNSRKSTGTFDLSYNLVPVVADNLPGISIGIRDALDRTEDGRGAFVAVTFKFNQYGIYNSNTPAEFTLGGGTGAYKGAFISAMLPIADQFRLVAEHDSRRLTAGISLHPRKDLAIHWMFRQDRTLLGADFRVKF